MRTAAFILLLTTTALAQYVYSSVGVAQLFTNNWPGGGFTTVFDATGNQPLCLGFGATGQSNQYYLQPKTCASTVGSTIANLPVGVFTGQIAYVTNSSACVRGVAPVAGGSTVCLVYHDGSTWLSL